MAANAISVGGQVHHLAGGGGGTSGPGASPSTLAAVLPTVPTPMEVQAGPSSHPNKRIKTEPMQHTVGTAGTVNASNRCDDLRIIVNERNSYVLTLHSKKGLGTQNYGIVTFGTS